MALLLAVVFATAIGVGTLVDPWPPTAGRIVLMGLQVIALLTFVAYKLGDRIGTILEHLHGLRAPRALVPHAAALGPADGGQPPRRGRHASSPLVAPFIYTL